MKTLLFTSLILTSFAFAQTNLINEELNSWATLSNNGAVANFTTAKSKKTQNKAIKVAVDRKGQAPWDIQMMQSFSSKKNRVYELTYDAKSTITGKSIVAQVQNKEYDYQTFELTNKWKTYEKTFISKENDLSLAFHFPEKGIFLLRNVSLKEIKKGNDKSAVITKSKLTSKIPNGGFEFGLDGWINLKENGGKAIYGITKNAPKEGTKCLRVLVEKFGDNPWDLQSFRSIKVKKNKNYKVSFYAKAGGRNKKVKIQIQDHPREIYIPFEFNVGSMNTWEKYEFDFTAESSSMELVIQHISLGLVEYDDFRITPIQEK